MVCLVAQPIEAFGDVCCMQVTLLVTIGLCSWYMYLLELAGAHVWYYAYMHSLVQPSLVLLPPSLPPSTPLPPLLSRSLPFSLLQSLLTHNFTHRLNNQSGTVTESLIHKGKLPVPKSCLDSHSGMSVCNKRHHCGPCSAWGTVSHYTPSLLSFHNTYHFGHALPSAVSIIDTGKCLFVWTGGKASPKEKRNSLPYAHVNMHAWQLICSSTLPFTFSLPSLLTLFSPTTELPDEDQAPTRPSQLLCAGQRVSRVLEGSCLES